MKYKMGDSVVLTGGTVTKIVKIGSSRLNEEGYVIEGFFALWFDDEIDHKATTELWAAEALSEKLEDGYYTLDISAKQVEVLQTQATAGAFKAEHNDIKNVWLNKSKKGYFATIELKDGRKATVKKADHDLHDWREAMWWAYTKALKSFIRYSYVGARSFTDLQDTPTSVL